MPRSRNKSTVAPLRRDGASFIDAVLRHASPRPDGKGAREAKLKYATTFAEKAAELIAEDLRSSLRGITATTKRTAGSVSGNKQLDVNFSTPTLGLALGISLKSVHIRETSGAKRYTHNKKRNEEELRIEAAGYHKRQPYAVMIGVLFLPIDSATDGKKGHPSSFGSWVRHLRPYAGRSGPLGQPDHLERIFVALYDPTGGPMRFFDVHAAPPKNGVPPLGETTGMALKPPNCSLTYEEFLGEVVQEFCNRNEVAFQWADGEADPIRRDDIED